MLSQIQQTRLSQASDVVNNWNLADPKAFLINREGKDVEHVERLAEEYKRYLLMVATFPEEQLPISRPVDEMWHAHMLFSADYVEISEQLQGKGGYIHHRPVKDEAERLSLEPSYHGNTLVHYHELFGVEAPIEFWPRDNGSICYGR